MTKRVFIIHGWEGTPNEGWLPWLKKELEQKGFKVFVPAMPKTEAPKIEAWVNYLAELVNTIDEKTFFVGHSIGCQAILRYLAGLPEGQKAGGVVLVAGWFNLPNLKTEKEKTIAKPWLETPIDLVKVEERVKKFVTIFSDDDPEVPLTDSQIFESQLGAKIIIEHSKGHFDGDYGINELPSVLEAILEISK